MPCSRQLAPLSYGVGVNPAGSDFPGRLKYRCTAPARSSISRAGRDSASHSEDRTAGPTPWTSCLASRCLNCDCPDHGKRGTGNLTVTSRYGPEKSRRMLRCRTCKTRFSEPKGMPPVDRRPPAGEGRVGPGARRRGPRRPPDRPALPGRPQHRRPLQPPGRRACRRCP